jgi:hypothetical protein
MFPPQQSWDVFAQQAVPQHLVVQFDAQVPPQPLPVLPARQVGHEGVQQAWL